LIRVSGSMACGDPEAIRDALGEAMGVAGQREIEETILQAYLFLGYPAALNTFAIWREVSGRESVPDVDADRGLEAASPLAQWEARGEAVCRVVYGGQYEKLRGNVRRLHPDMERWMVVEGYGKVLGRPGLDLRVRELCIVAILAIQGAHRQLYSHLRGAVNAGAGDGQIEEALSLAAEWQSPGASEASRGVWAQVRGRGR
jgi:4-carboxymuconolactone decarboxylase